MENVVKATNETPEGTLRCSICGDAGFKVLSQHLVSKHNIRSKEYLRMFPNDKTFVDELRKSYSKGGYNANKVMKEKGLDFSERSRKARKTELKNDPEAYVKRNRKLCQDPEFKERATRRILSATRWHGGRYQYNENSFRSTWEVKFAKWLDSEKISFEYEGVKVKYLDLERGYERVYYPDFYLPDQNLCVEIKPKVYLSSDVVKAKRDACLNAGYNFIFITQDELNNLSTNLLNV